jgi:monovalent cation/hydrogen antiporter
VYDDLAAHCRQRLAIVTSADGEGGPAAKDRRRFSEVSRELLRTEREMAIRLRDERRINDEVLREIERELDLREARLQAVEVN